MTPHMHLRNDPHWRPATLRRAHSHMVRAYVYGALALADMLAVLLSFVLTDVVRHDGIKDSVNPVYLLIVPVFVAVSFYSRAYSYASVMSLRRGATQVATSLMVAVALTLIVIFALKSSEDLSRAAFFAGSVVSAAALVAVRLPLRSVIARLGTRFMWRVLVVDGIYGDPVPSTFEVLDVAAAGIRPDITDPMMLHRFSRLVAGADRVVVACPVEHRASWSLYLKSVDCSGELLIPELMSVDMLRPKDHSGLFGVRVSAGSLDMRDRMLKRLFDLALTVPAIVILSPLFVLTAIAVALESRGPILFRQERMGRANQLFNVYKFRSMYVDRTDHDGTCSTSRTDSRVTRVGRFIRATSIDELPQLFNVINGDMSLVGPRPHALGSRAGDKPFWDVDERYWLRHAIKPGLTGLAQVRGFRGATDHSDDLANRLESDLDYLANWSIVSDAAIIARTLLVLVHRNAY